MGTTTRLALTTLTMTPQVFCPQAFVFMAGWQDVTKYNLYLLLFFFSPDLVTAVCYCYCLSWANHLVGKDF